MKYEPVALLVYLNLQNIFSFCWRTANQQQQKKEEKKIIIQKLYLILNLSNFLEYF